MTAPTPIPASLLEDDDFLGSVDDDHLVYFLCNVGDADAQVVLLPKEEHSDRRRAMVIDAGATKKVPELLRSLAGASLITSENGDLEPGSIALVVATHPHHDHVAGIPEVLHEFGGAIAEFWDPGYFHPLPAYHQMMAEVEHQQTMLYAQPTSGLRRWIGNLAVTVLSPSIHLRNRFDTYGTEINDSSISLRLEFPAARVIERDEERNYVGGRNTQSLILGADAQTLSWSFVGADFPYLHASESAAAKILRMATGGDPLRGDVFKVSHHGSKHGVNLELVARIDPSITLVSSVADRGAYNFPHSVAQELIREALHPTTKSREAHPPDYELKIFYTCDVLEDSKEPLGSFALVISKGKREMWRFGDDSKDPIDLTKAKRWK